MPIRTPRIPTRDGHRLSSKRIQDILEDVGRKAGIAPRLAAHRLRRTYATLALKYGSNLEYVKITLGHSDVETTSQSYINIADDDIAAAYRKFSPMINLMQAESKESPGIEARTKASKEILKTETDLELSPTSAEPQFMQTPQGKRHYPPDAGVSECFNSLLYIGVNATFTTGNRTYLYSHPPLTFSFEES